MLKRVKNNPELMTIAGLCPTSYAHKEVFRPLYIDMTVLRCAFLCMCIGVTTLSSNKAFADCTAPSSPAGGIDYDGTTKTRKICDGTNWKLLEEFDYSTSGARQKIQIANDTGGCTGEKTGRLRYNGTSTWEYCNGSAWVPFEAAGCIGPAGCSNVGDVCADGTVYAGMAAPVYEPTFVTRCDAGQTWSGSACTGTRSTLAWNNGNTTGYTTTAATDFDGRINSAILVSVDSNSASGGVQPHLAAQYCDNLNIHGKTDWYLPSISETHMIWVSRNEIGNIVLNTFHSSNERDATNSFVQGITNGGQYTDSKDNTRYIRCARRDSTLDPCSTTTTPGTVCSDGSVYAGISTDNGAKMFTTPADGPQNPWNNDTLNWVDTAMVNCTTTAQTSCNTGEANTTLLAGLSDAASPYMAAEYCEGLSAHGKSDWYLPALNELSVLYTNRAAIGGFSSGLYWTSSERSNEWARDINFSNGVQNYNGKSAETTNVRCVRN